MKAIFFIVSMMTIISFSARAQDATTIRKRQFNLNNENIAIKGYDPVVYFTVNGAVKGAKEPAVYHQGVVYYFSSLENKEDFKKNPSKYEPEYGGWCAYAMGAQEDKVNIDPETFKILNDRLFLFYNRNFSNTLRSRNKDETNLKAKADISRKNIFH